MDESGRETWNPVLAIGRALAESGLMIQRSKTLPAFSKYTISTYD